MSLKKSLAVGALAMALPMSAMAVSDFKVNGFANAGFTWTDTDETYLFTTKDGSFSEASFFGLQMRFAPSTDVPITFVTQLLAKGRSGWNVDADWAFVNWKVNDDFSINVGKVKLPIFLISEAYDVGITYPWIAPPEEIYGFANVPFTSITGLSLDYNHYFDETWINAKFYMGKDTAEIPALGAKVPVEVQQMFGAVFSVGGENWELRASTAVVDLYVPIADTLQSLPVAQAMQAEIGAAIMEATAGLAGANSAVLGAQAQLDAALATGTPAEQAAAGAAYAGALGNLDTAGAALASAAGEAANIEALFAVIPNGSGEADFYSLGFRYDGDRAFVMTELARRGVDGVPFPDTDAAFVTVGYRMDKFTPHLTYSTIETEDSILVNQSQSSIIMGVRYDVQPWAALKFELQYTELGDPTIREYGPLVGSELLSNGLFNELPDLATFAGDVPDELIRAQVAFTMVF